MSPELCVQRKWILAKIDDFERRTYLRRPVFNIDADEESESENVSLRASRNYGYGPGILSLTKREFEILDILCTHPIPYKEMAILLNRSENRIKDGLSSIYKKLGLQGEKGTHLQQNRTIWKLINLGMLSYEPSIQHDSFTQ